MTTQEVAEKLVTLCREGKYDVVYSELFSQEASSIEPEGTYWGTKKGMEAIYAKGKEWNQMVEEFISGEVGDPIVADNYFAVVMKMEVKIKGAAASEKMEEICLYHVENGKIMSEQFFYTPQTEKASL